MPSKTQQEEKREKKGKAHSGKGGANHWRPVKVENEVIPEVPVALRSGEVGRLELVDMDLVPDMELVVSKAWTRTMGLTEK